MIDGKNKHLKSNRPGFAPSQTVPVKYKQSFSPNSCEVEFTQYVDKVVFDEIRKNTVPLDDLLKWVEENKFKVSEKSVELLNSSDLKSAITKMAE
jgi:hypothetical protein